MCWIWYEASFHTRRNELWEKHLCCWRMFETKCDGDCGMCDVDDWFQFESTSHIFNKRLNVHAIWRLHWKCHHHDNFVINIHITLVFCQTFYWIVIIHFQFKKAFAIFESSNACYSFQSTLDDTINVVEDTMEILVLGNDLY